MPISAATKAIAAEALIRLPDLPPLARRLGIELLNRADKRTGVCWPSEARLAQALGCDERSIRRAKKALLDAGLLTWASRGPHKTPIYSLAWAALKALAANIKAKITAAFTPTPRPSSVSPSAENQSPSKANPAPSQPATRNSATGNSGRTFWSSNLTQILKTRTGWGSAGLQPFNPRQILTDQQLDARASARFYTALQHLGADIMAQFIARPDADMLQTKAVKAERYNPGAGIKTLAHLLGEQVRATA